jgi:predicted Holliday junction resolvase-like endonuclease
MEKFLWILGLLVVGGPLVYISYLRRRLNVVLGMLEQQSTRQRSLSASYGRITEQWFPLMERYPYDSANFRFLGTPIDGVQFEEDKIIFVEFKARNAELSTTQRRMKQLVQAGKVTWEEFHFLSD